MPLDELAGSLHVLCHMRAATMYRLYTLRDTVNIVGPLQML